MARASKAADGPRGAMVILYHPVTGALVHVHSVWAEGDAALPARTALEREAVANAERHAARHGGVAVSSLPRLHVDPRGFDAARAYRVDVRKRALVPLTRRGAAPRGKTQ